MKGKNRMSKFENNFSVPKRKSILTYNNNKSGFEAKYIPRPFKHSASTSKANIENLTDSTDDIKDNSNNDA